jgi:hypothetical protein
MDINNLGKNFYFKRDAQSFTNLYLELRPLLINWLKQKFRVNHDKAIEIVDGSLEKIYLRIGQYDPKYPFLNWVFQIVKNDFKRDYNLTHSLILFAEPTPKIEKYIENSEYIYEDRFDIEEIEEQKIALAARNLLKDPSIENLLGEFYKFRINMFLEYVDPSSRETHDSIAKKHNIATHNVIKYFYQIRRMLFNELKNNNLNRKLNYSIVPYHYEKMADCSTC